MHLSAGDGLGLLANLQREPRCSETTLRILSISLVLRILDVHLLICLD